MCNASVDRIANTIILINLVAALHLYTVSALIEVSKGTIVIELAKLKSITGKTKKCVENNCIQVKFQYAVCLLIMN